MLTPSHTEQVTIPVDISAVGNNVIVPEFIPSNGTHTGATFIHNVKIFPDAPTEIILKAVDNVTATERILDAGGTYTAGQPFIIENTSPDGVYLFRLNEHEEFVVELSAASQCTGFTNVSYFMY